MRVVKLLLCSDLHLDAPFTWAGPRVGRMLRTALRTALLRVVETADEERVDALCIAGDLFEHDYAGPDTGAFLRSAFGELSCPVLLAPGNHDWLGPTSLYGRVAWPSNVHVFSGDRLQPYELRSGTVFGAAHLAPANTDGFLDDFRLDDFPAGHSGVSVGLFHGSERGTLAGQGEGKVPHAPFTARQVERSGLAHVLVGHYHRPVHGPWHTYAGNPEPLAFGEDGPRGAVLLGVTADGAVRRAVIPVAARVWQDVTVHVEAARHAGEVRDLVRAELAGRDGLVRLRVAGSCAPELDVGALELADLGAHLDALVVRPAQLRPAYDLAALAAEGTVRGAFVRDVLASDLDGEQAERVLTAGLLALDGRAAELAGADARGPLAAGSR